MEASGNLKIEVTFLMLEIYNEKIQDLLNAKGKDLKVTFRFYHESPLPPQHPYPRRVASHC